MDYCVKTAQEMEEERRRKEQSTRMMVSSAYFWEVDRSEGVGTRGQATDLFENDEEKKTKDSRNDAKAYTPGIFESFAQESRRTSASTTPMVSMQRAEEITKEQARQWVNLTSKEMMDTAETLRKATNLMTPDTAEDEERKKKEKKEAKEREEYWQNWTSEKRKKEAEVEAWQEKQVEKFAKEVQFKGGTEEQREQKRKELKKFGDAVGMIQSNAMVRKCLETMKDREARGLQPTPAQEYALATLLTGGLSKEDTATLQQAVHREKVDAATQKMIESIKQEGAVMAAPTKEQVENLKHVRFSHSAEPMEVIRLQQWMKADLINLEAIGTSDPRRLEIDRKRQISTRKYLEQDYAPETEAKVRRFMRESPKCVIEDKTELERAKRCPRLVLTKFLRLHEEKVLIVAAYWVLKDEPYLPVLEDETAIWEKEWNSAENIMKLEKFTGPKADRPLNVADVLDKEKYMQGDTLFEDCLLYTSDAADE